MKDKINLSNAEMSSGKVILSYLPVKSTIENDSVKLIVPDEYINFKTGVVDIKSYVEDLSKCFVNNGISQAVELEYEK